jgi:bifunctional non-homologous end joining protein LigD
MSPSPLSKYREKRDASKTNEPAGDELDSSEVDKPGQGTTWRGAFVVHQHDATRMHYDLRLEVAGVLKSFAIPHGPSLDPEVKNLAVHTEDHPIEYLDFEAVIPEGNYGAGAMIAWDMGVVRYLDMAAEDGIRTGKLHFSLEGRKLRGRYGMVRLKPKERRNAPPESIKEWLFFKKQDAAASKRDLLSENRSVLSGLTVSELLEAPEIARRVEQKAKKLGAVKAVVDGRKLSPMLCSLDALPTGPGWIYELKMDGVRVLATKDEKGVDLMYRSGRKTTGAYPEVARAVGALFPANLVLDGEIVAFDDSGKPNFERLARRIHTSPRSDMRKALSEVPVVFVVFDLLAIGGMSLMELPLSKRKALLAELIPAPGILRVLDHMESGGAALFDFCRQNGIEGVVSKRADSRYVAGPGRTALWVKTKTEQEALFVVIGYTHGENSRHRLGALDLGSYEDGKLLVRGRAGSGLNDERIDELLDLLKGSVTDRASAMGDYEPAQRGRVHVHPTLVVRVRFLEWSEDGALRFPVYLGIEHGVAPTSCTIGPHDEDHVRGSAQQNSPLVEEEPAIEVKVSNRQKIFWPEEKYTKGDLVDYYETIAPFLMPYLADRPVMLVRYPDGIGGKSFFQWNVPHGKPAWVRSVVLGKHVASADEGDNKKHVFIIDRLESLIYIANLACIPVHILSSRVATPSACDFLTIDFDINLSTLAIAVGLAQTLRSVLDEVGLKGFPKTSGQTGLHVFVPMGDGVTPSAAKTLAELMGRIIVERHPTAATMERVVARRGNKVYVDTGQTGPSRTIVAPYSLRATPGARVSMPLSWDEVDPSLDPAAFTIKTAPLRVEREGDKMAGLLSEKPDMPEVMQRLASLLGGRSR